MEGRYYCSVGETTAIIFGPDNKKVFTIHKEYGVDEKLWMMVVSDVVDNLNGESTKNGSST